MNPQTLRAFAVARGLSQADIARAVGVSRQTVSNWFGSKEKTTNLYWKHLERIAAVLNVSVGVLSNSLPIIGNSQERKTWETELLWDRIYPDLESFLRGLLLEETAAIARLVQVVGLFQAEKIIGKKVWRRFPEFKKLIHPARRSTLETLWTLHLNPP